MTQIKGFKINGTAYTEQNISDFVSHLTSPDGTDYILKVTNEGNLYVETEPKVQPLNPPTTEGLVTYWAHKEVDSSCLLYINSFYCGGENANEHTMNYCSHNFVELSNLTNTDINLQGITLQYSVQGGSWEALPLKGIIKAGSTFVIRGAQCSMLNSPLLKINVDKYDMEWYNSNGVLIPFNCEQRVKFYLGFNLESLKVTTPYNEDTSLGVSIGYIDLVGINGTVTEGADAYEKKPYSKGILSNSKLYRKYYAMDPVKQANKAMKSRNNANDWCYIDLSKNDGELIPSISVYKPMASLENKNLFYNKTNLFEHKPSMITCTLGIQATDNGSGATRCFNWITKDSTNKYIWIRPKNSESWGSPNESFYTGDKRTTFNEDNLKIDGVSVYDRQIKEYTNNTGVIINKFIISGLSAGEYEYIAGSKNTNNTPNIEYCTDIRSFKVRSNDEVSEGFKFVQTSDQQGFNWEEYRIWNASAKVITSENPDIEFMINTGDMTQNGNRMGEWLDYFNGKNSSLNNLEEMATIGNNDLSLNVLYKVGNGGDNEKIWHENITLFYTFEYDPENPPIFAITVKSVEKRYFVPSLYSFNYGFTHFMCINSEIKMATETNEYGYNFGDNNYGNFYPKIKEWCENDILKNNSDWNIAYCHEMPFTIMTPDKVLLSSDKGESEVAKDRSGGSNANDNNPANNVFWLSEFCQTHNIPLMLGGHKHTQSTSYPLLENISYENETRTVKSIQPIIVVNTETLKEFENATSLVEYNGVIEEFIGNFYPNTWLSNGEPQSSSYKRMMQMSKFVMENDESITGVTPVVYAMSQATGYKHTSNKELPSPKIPWLRYYFKAEVKNNATLEQLKSPTVNAFQKFPFYTIWNIMPSKIEGNVRKVYGAFNDDGNFDINVDGPYVLNGYCATSKAEAIARHTDKIFSINGITSMTDLEAKTDTRIITINK